VVPEFPQLRISFGSFNPSKPNPEIVKGSFFFISGMFTPNFLRQSAVESGSSECKNPSIVVSPLAILPIIKALWEIDLSPGTFTYPFKLIQPFIVRILFNFKLILDKIL